MRNCCKDFIYTVVLIMTEVTTEVNLKIVVIRAHEETASHVRVGNRCTRAGLHGDFEVSGTVIRAVVCCFREVGLNVDTNILSCCCYDFKGCIPVRPSCRALSLIGKVLSVVLTDSVSVGVYDSGIVQKLLSTFYIGIGPLILLLRHPDPP